MPTASFSFFPFHTALRTLLLGSLMLGSLLTGACAWGQAESQQEASAPPEPVFAPLGQISEAQKSWLDEIAAIEAETTILQKREELDTRVIEAQTRVLKKREELETLVRETTAEMLAHLPSVISIMGMEGNYQSQIYYPSGRKAYVRVGDRISPDVRVVDISPAGVEVDVTLGRNSERRRVPLNFIGLADRNVESTESMGREQVEVAKDVVLPRRGGQQSADGDAAAVINVIRALAGGGKP